MEFILPPQQSESLDQLLPAFAAAQNEYPDFIKNRTGQFKYMDLVELVGMVKPVLFKNKLVFHHKQYPCTDGSRMLGTILYHFPSGQYIESRSWIPIDQSGKRSLHQEFGAAMSYHRRYELMALLNLTPEDESDNDGQVYTPRQPHAPQSNLATDKQKEFLKKLLTEKRIQSVPFFEKHGVEKPEDLTSERISLMIKELTH
jgi:hypothetical protein